MPAQTREEILVTLTPARVLRVFLPVSCAVFFVSLAIAALFLFQDKPFDIKDLVISDLVSPEDNPRGYGYAAVGIALCGIILLPAAALFYLRLRTVRRHLAAAGTFLFTTGLAAVIAIGVLAPFTRDYTPVHVRLALSAFTGLCAGTLLCMLAIVISRAQAGLPSRALYGKLLLDCAVLAFLVYLAVAPRPFNNHHVLTSLALWEWLLCFDCVASIALLLQALDSPPPKVPVRY